MFPLTASKAKKAHADIDLLSLNVIDFKAAKKAAKAQERMLILSEDVWDRLYTEWGEDIAEA